MGFLVFSVALHGDAAHVKGTRAANRTAGVGNINVLGVVGHAARDWGPT